MSETLSSFLITVSIIAAIALFVPCLESFVRLLRRNARGDKAQGQDAPANNKGSKAYSREIA